MKLQTIWVGKECFVVEKIAHNGTIHVTNSDIGYNNVFYGYNMHEIRGMLADYVKYDMKG